MARPVKHWPQRDLAQNRVQRARDRVEPSFSYILLVDPITRAWPRRPARRPFSARGAPPGEPRGGPRPPRPAEGRRRRGRGAQRPREGPTAPCERNGRPRRGPPENEAESAPRATPPRCPPGRGGVSRGAQEVPRRSLATPFGHESRQEAASTENRRDRPCVPAERNDRPGRAPTPPPRTGRRGSAPGPCRRGPRRAEAAGVGTRRMSHGRSATPFGQESLQ